MGVIQGKGKDIRRGGKKKLKSVFGLQDQDRNRSAHFSPGSGHWTRLPWRVHFRPDLLRKKPGEVRWHAWLLFCADGILLFNPRQKWPKIDVNMFISKRSEFSSFQEYLFHHPLPNLLPSPLHWALTAHWTLLPSWAPGLEVSVHQHPQLYSSSCFTTLRAIPRACCCPRRGVRPSPPPDSPLPGSAALQYCPIFHSSLSPPLSHLLLSPLPPSSYSNREELFLALISVLSESTPISVASTIITTREF